MFSEHILELPALWCVFQWWGEVRSVVHGRVWDNNHCVRQSQWRQGWWLDWDQGRGRLYSINNLLNYFRSKLIFLETVLWPSDHLSLIRQSQLEMVSLRSIIIIIMDLMAKFQEWKYLSSKKNRKICLKYSFIIDFLIEQKLENTVQCTTYIDIDWHE